MANLKVLVASLLLWSIPGAFTQREDIVAGALMARAAESFGTILDGEAPAEAAAAVVDKTVQVLPPAFGLGWGLRHPINRFFDAVHA